MNVYLHSCSRPIVAFIGDGGGNFILIFTYLARLSRSMRFLHTGPSYYLDG